MSDSLQTPWTVACQAPLSLGFPRQEYWSELPFPSPGDLSDPGIDPMSLVSPALHTDSLPAEPSGKPLGKTVCTKYLPFSDLWSFRAPPSGKEPCHVCCSWDAQALSWWWLPPSPEGQAGYILPFAPPDHQRPVQYQRLERSLALCLTPQTCTPKKGGRPADWNGEMQENRWQTAFQTVSTRPR